MLPVHVAENRAQRQASLKRAALALHLPAVGGRRKIIGHAGNVRQAPGLGAVLAQLGGMVPADAVQHRLPRGIGQQRPQRLPAQAAVPPGAAPGAVNELAKIMQQAAVRGKQGLFVQVFSLLIFSMSPCGDEVFLPKKSSKLRKLITVPLRG